MHLMEEAIKNPWDPKTSGWNDSFGGGCGLPNIWDHPFGDNVRDERTLSWRFFNQVFVVRVGN